jgi:hypothetical protein
VILISPTGLFPTYIRRTTYYQHSRPATLSATIALLINRTLSLSLSPSEEEPSFEQPYLATIYLDLFSRYPLLISVSDTKQKNESESESEKSEYERVT